MPSTIASDARVDALWWLLNGAGYSMAFHKPGDRYYQKGKGPSQVHTDFGVVLGDAKTSTTVTLQAPTRDELIDRIVALRIEERLSR